MGKEQENYFSELNSINVQDKTEKKGNLTYLSWAWAWGELKKLHPDATYTIYENADGLFYHHDGRTAWVKTGVTVNGIEHIEYLPVMDFKNQSVSVDKITSTQVNKTIQRSLTKAVARHGLGLYIYAGEDLPEGEQKQEKNPNAAGYPPRSSMLEAIYKKYPRGTSVYEAMINAIGVNDIESAPDEQIMAVYNKASKK